MTWHVTLFGFQVTWLVSWTENIQGAIKYVMLNPTSRLKVSSVNRIVEVEHYGLCVCVSGRERLVQV